MILTGKHILLGVTGGIAAFKAVLLLRLLTKAGAQVSVVMTPAATRFVTPLTFEALSGRKVEVDLWESTRAGGESHIRLAVAADAVVIAPASANFLAEQAHGLCRDLLGAVCLATRAPLLVAPAMHENMWHKPSVQRTMALLEADGVRRVGPVSGELATGEGDGRMAEPEAIFEALIHALSPQDLAGRAVLISAGPTREPLDPVRFLSNRSTGKMGYALARAAARRGARVSLVSGPTDLPAPAGVERIPVETAAQMREAMVARFEGCDAAILSAAVADFTPASYSEEKIKKKDAAAEPSLPLRRTADILAELGASRQRQILVGFAMETQDLLINARRKLTAKGCDLIVANSLKDAGAGFGHDTNRVTIVQKDAEDIVLPLLSKDEVADRILDRVIGLLEDRR